MTRTSLTERLGLVGYRNQRRSDPKPHIIVDTSICNGGCPHKGTAYSCPARCYTFNDAGDIQFEFEDCIECGTCLYVCDQGAVDWHFPDPERGRGVNWSLG